MAQLTATTPSITTTSGKTVTNQPVNPDNVVRAIAGEQFSGDACDLNKYPVVVIEIVTGATQYWFYDLNDEATRNSDLALF